MMTKQPVCYIFPRYVCIRISMALTIQKCILEKHSTQQFICSLLFFLIFISQSLLISVPSSKKHPYFWPIVQVSLCKDFATVKFKQFLIMESIGANCLMHQVKCDLFDPCAARGIPPPLLPTDCRQLTSVIHTTR